MIEEPLEPPGTIAVIGAGPIGLEAALYGRFLGYEVTVFEAQRIAERWRSRGDQPVPFYPGRGLSPLASSALQTQRDGAAPLPRSLPMTTGEWIEQSLEALAETDLLAGRVQAHCRVTALSFAPDAAADEVGETDGPSDADAWDGDAEGAATEGDEAVPADFLLELARDDGGREVVRAEVVIDTTAGGGGGTGHAFAVPDAEAFQRLGESAEEGDFRTAVPYFYRIDSGPIEASQNAKSLGLTLEIGWDRIRRLYALLGDRSSLDLYRPLRR